MRGPAGLQACCLAAVALALCQRCPTSRSASPQVFIENPDAMDAPEILSFADDDDDDDDEYDDQTDAAGQADGCIPLRIAFALLDARMEVPNLDRAHCTRATGPVLGRASACRGSVFDDLLQADEESVPQAVSDKEEGEHPWYWNQLHPIGCGREVASRDARLGDSALLQRGIFTREMPDALVLVKVGSAQRVICGVANDADAPIKILRAQFSAVSVSSSDDGIPYEIPGETLGYIIQPGEELTLSLRLVFPESRLGIKARLSATLQLQREDQGQGDGAASVLETQEFLSLLIETAHFEDPLDSAHRTSASVLSFALTVSALLLVYLRLSDALKTFSYAKALSL